MSETPEYWLKHFNHDGPVREAPVNPPKGPPPPPQPRDGSSGRPTGSPPGLTTASHRPWVEFAVLFAGALLGSVIGSTAATAFVIWLMVV